jgi:hypothetical protein
MSIATISLATFVDDAGIGTAVWSNPGDAASSDDVKASATAGPSVVTHYLKGTAGSAGSIPTGSTINSVTAKAEGNRGTRVFQEAAVKAVKGGAIQATDRKTTNLWTAADAVYSYALTAESFTVSELNDSGVGFVIALTNTEGAPGAVNIDRMFLEVDYTASDTTKPVFASAAVPVNGLTLSVTLTEADSLPILPASGCTGFSVTVDGAARTISSATASGNIVTLTLASPPVFAGQTVNVEYSPGNVTDSAATPNAMLAFAAQSVTNNSTDTPAVRLNFTSPAAGNTISVFKVLHATTGEPPQAGQEMDAGTGSTYLDAAVAPGRTYNYWAKTRRTSDGAYSAGSAVTEITIPGTPPPAPPGNPTGFTIAVE